MAGGGNSEAVARAAAPLGFALLGVAEAGPVDERDAAALRELLDRGGQGDMTFLADALAARLDPCKLLPGARSIIVVADEHAYRHGAPGATPHPHPATRLTGRIARYAWGDDYHRVVKQRLHRLADDLRVRWPGHDFRSCVDTAPVMERPHAARAGLGFIGKHTLLIHPTRGSWLLLGLIVTTLPLEPSTPLNTSDSIRGRGCGTCTRCIDACPTRAIAPQGYAIEPTRCISYLTIEHRGRIDESLQLSMGDWVAGCDVCQEVCPFNAGGVEGSGVRVQGEDADAERGRASHPEPRTPNPEPSPRYAARFPAPATPLAELLQWTVADRRRAFTRSALKRIKLDQLLRNALIAAGNCVAREPGHPDAAVLRRRIEEMASDASQPPLVRETAVQVAARLPAVQA